MPQALQQRLALVAAVLVLAGSLATLALNDDGDEVVLTVPSPSANASAVPSVAPSATQGAVPSVGPAATVAPPSLRPAPTPYLPIAKRPKPGTYIYRERVGDQTAEANLEIADRGTGRQSEEQQGIRADILWSEESKLIDKIAFGVSPFNFDCDFAPNIAELKFPLKVGAVWNMLGKCSSSGVTVTFTGSTKVTELTKRTVSGTSIDVWRMLQKVKIAFKSAEGSFEENVESDTFLAPHYGLYVYSTDKTTGTDPATGEEINETSVMELQNLSPV